MAGRCPRRPRAPVDGPGRARRAGTVRGTRRSGGRARPTDALGTRGPGVSLTAIIAGFSAIVPASFVLGNVCQILMGAAGARFAWRSQRRRNVRSRALVARLASPPLVSLVVPAHN